MDFNHSKHERICYNNIISPYKKCYKFIKLLYKFPFHVAFNASQLIHIYYYVNWSSWRRNHFMYLVLNSWSHEPTWPWHYGSMHMDPFQCYCSFSQTNYNGWQHIKPTMYIRIPQKNSNYLDFVKSPNCPN